MACHGRLKASGQRPEHGGRSDADGPGRAGLARLDRRRTRLTLGRSPSPAENDRALTYIESDPARLKGFAWLLFNLDEFIYVR